MNTAEKPRVYSYTRFSSPEQAKGNSEQRQVEAARKFAKSKNLVLDEILDKGRSAYHSEHKEKGAFGAFLEDVKSGAVPRGSILLVENNDRLSREPLDEAQTTMLNLLQHGITIAFLVPPKEVTLDSYNREDGIWLAIEMKRAHAESERKSELAFDNWQNRRSALYTGAKLTARAPAWLKVIPHIENKHVVSHDMAPIPEAVETVRLIFQLKRDGFGKYAIERKLNKCATWRPVNKKGESKGWRASYVDKILRNRAVLGEFQPYKRDVKTGERVPEGDPIQGYYPQIINHQTWHAVQAGIKANKGKGGKTGSATNVFQHLVICGYCGGPMHLNSKGPPPKGAKYLICDNGKRRFKCNASAVRYDEFQETMLDNLSKLKPELVLPNPGKRAAQAKAFRLALDGINEELVSIENEIVNFTKAVGKTNIDSMRERYEKQIADLEKKTATLTAERDKKRIQLQEVEHGKQSFDKWQAGIAGLKQAVTKDVDVRIRLRTHLKEFIEKIEVFAKGHEDHVDWIDEVFAEVFPELLSSKFYPQFRRENRARLLSRDGRFYKLFLKQRWPLEPPFLEIKAAKKRAGKRSKVKKERKVLRYSNAWTKIPDAGLVLAPVGSLAPAVSHTRKGMKAHSVALDKFIQEFFDDPKPGQFVPKTASV